MTFASKRRDAVNLRTPALARICFEVFRLVICLETYLTYLYLKSIVQRFHKMAEQQNVSIAYVPIDCCLKHYTYIISGTDKQKASRATNSRLNYNLLSD